MLMFSRDYYTFGVVLGRCWFEVDMVLDFVDFFLVDFYFFRIGVGRVMS